MNEKYVKHIKKCCDFAETTVDKELLLEGIISTNLKLKLFDKCASPYHYFLEDEPKEPKPTEKQIEYAKKLGIKNPETYTKKTLSKKIDGVLQNE